MSVTYRGKAYEIAYGARGGAYITLGRNKTLYLNKFSRDERASNPNVFNVETHRFVRPVKTQRPAPRTASPSRRVPAQPRAAAGATPNDVRNLQLMVRDLQEQLQSSVRNLQERLTVATDRSRDEEVRREEYEEEKEEDDEAQYEYREELERQREELNQLSAQLEATKTRNRLLAQQNADLAARQQTEARGIRSSETAIEELNNELANCRGTVLSMEQKLAQLRADRDTQFANATSCERQRHDEQDRLAALLKVSTPVPAVPVAVESRILPTPVVLPPPGAPTSLTEQLAAIGVVPAPILGVAETFPSAPLVSAPVATAAPLLPVLFPTLRTNPTTQEVAAKRELGKEIADENRRLAAEDTRLRLLASQANTLLPLR